jgi:hypothetical protein
LKIAFNTTVKSKGQISPTEDDAFVAIKRLPGERPVSEEEKEKLKSQKLQPEELTPEIYQQFIDEQHGLQATFLMDDALTPRYPVFLLQSVCEEWIKHLLSPEGSDPPQSESQLTLMDLQSQQKNGDVLIALRKYFNCGNLGNGMNYSIAYWDPLCYHITPAFELLTKHNMKTLLRTLSNPFEKQVALDKKDVEEFSHCIPILYRNLTALALLQLMNATIDALMKTQSLPLPSGGALKYILNSEIITSTWHTSRRCVSLDGRHVFFVPDFHEAEYLAHTPRQEHQDIGHHALMTWLQFSLSSVNYSILCIPTTRKTPTDTDEPSDNPLVDHLTASAGVDMVVRYVLGKPYSLVVLAAGGNASIANPINIGRNETLDSSAFPCSLCEFLLHPTQNTTGNEVCCFMVERFPTNEMKFIHKQRVYNVKDTSSLRILTQLHDPEHGNYPGQCEIAGIVNKHFVFHGLCQFDSGIHDYTEVDLLSALEEHDREKKWKSIPADNQQQLFYYHKGRAVALVNSKSEIVSFKIFDKETGDNLVIYVDGNNNRLNYAHGLTKGFVFLAKDQNLFMADKKIYRKLLLSTGGGSIIEEAVGHNVPLVHAHSKVHYHTLADNPNKLFYFDDFGMGIYGEQEDSNGIPSTLLEPSQFIYSKRPNEQ